MTKRKLILSTNNFDKVEEIKDILKELPVDILSKKDLNLENVDIVEDGKTLEENATKKSYGFKRKGRGNNNR